MEKANPKVQRLLEMQHNDPAHFWGSLEMFVLIGVIILIAALFFIWAKYIRKPRRPSSRVLSSAKEKKPIGGIAPNQRRRRRRWGKRNPTLAETGGLPPVKTPPTA